MKVSKRVLLFLVLIVYAGLYIATKPDLCEDDCQKYGNFQVLMTANRPYILSAGACSATLICIGVNDSVQRNWAVLADTACSYIKKVGLAGKSVALVSAWNQDTLAQQTCP